MDHERWYSRLLFLAPLFPIIAERPLDPQLLDLLPERVAVDAEELLARVQTHMELRQIRVELEKQAIKLSLANEQLQCKIVERKKAEEGAQQKANVLQEAMNKIKILSGLQPICSHCNKIRNEKGYWTQLEAYISEHSDTEFTHGICDECLNKLYPDYIGEKPDISGEKE